MSGASNLPDVLVTTKTKPREETRTRRLPPYHVIIENDDHHSFPFVVDVLCKVFGYSVQRAFVLMLKAHTSGQAVVWTGPKEVGELKVDQIRTYHEIREPDHVALGPLSCRLEPAPG